MQVAPVEGRVLRATVSRIEGEAWITGGPNLALPGLKIREKLFARLDVVKCSSGGAGSVMTTRCNEFFIPGMTRPFHGFRFWRDGSNAWHAHLGSDVARHLVLAAGDIVHVSILCEPWPRKVSLGTFTIQDDPPAAPPVAPPAAPQQVAAQN